MKREYDALTRSRLGGPQSAFLIAVGLGLSLSGVAVAADSFAALMHAAMARMDKAMMATSSGDPDRDFATMMIPHHQAAIDMAAAELRFGHDEKLRRLAQAIIVEQRQEIVVMQDALKNLLAFAAGPASGSAPSPLSPPPMSVDGMTSHPPKGQ